MSRPDAAGASSGRVLPVVSLGPGGADQMTIEANRVLLEATTIYCRFSTPLLDQLGREHGKSIVSLHRLYERPDLVRGLDRRPLYVAIAEHVVRAAMARDGIVYAVPGSALALEDTTYLIRERAAVRGLEVRTILGVSFVDVVLDALPPRYRKHSRAPRLLAVGRLDVPISTCVSYLIAQSADLVGRYPPGELDAILARHYPADHAILLVHGEYRPEARAVETRVVEFARGEIESRRDLLAERNGTIFIPSRSGHYEDVYGDLLGRPPGSG